MKFIKIILIIEGPPASGKTTFSSLLSVKWNIVRITYKGLGFANILAKLLKFVLESSWQDKNEENTRYDTILKIKRGIIIKIKYLVFLLEIIYKSIQFCKLILYCIIYRKLIIDEFIILRWSNYIYLKELSIFNKKNVIFLFRMDLGILNILNKLSKVIYIYINRPLPTLIKFWRKRGHKRKYDVRFFVINKVIMKYVQKSLNKNIKFILL